jgi:hypothetical protein
MQPKRAEWSLVRWLKESNTATDVITYSVVNGYHLRQRLGPLGFHFDDRMKKWSCTVASAEVARIEQIETLLKGYDRSGSPRVPDTPPEPSPSRPSTTDVRWIDALLREKSWLYQGEVSLLESMRRQAQAGRTLSDKQRKALKEIRQKVKTRQDPKFLPGGSPGQGRRRR